jgi:hypothetical protein
VGVGGIGRLGWTTDVDPTAEERVRGWGHWGGAARKSLLEHAKIGERRNGATQQRVLSNSFRTSVKKKKLVSDMYAP